LDKLNDELKKDMQAKQIDVSLALSILEKFNRGDYDSVEPIRPRGIPGVDGKRVLDLTNRITVTVPAREAMQRLDGFGVPLRLESRGHTDGEATVFDTAALQSLGTDLLPTVAYGVLNGGSATSYADTKKNRSFNQRLFDVVHPVFEELADQCRGRAKGLTPAFLNDDGSPGPSFLELKMRAILIAALKWQQIHQGRGAEGPAMFQMTSVSNDGEVADAYRRYRESPALASLMQATGIADTDVATGVQPLVCAYTHSKHGRPKEVFAHAHGKPDNALPLPGGHGQNFMVLRDVYRRLRDNGRRFAYLGNVDNLGFTINPVAVGYLAATGMPAGFEFSFRTAVDVKGGILVEDQHERLNCADIGPAISKDDVFEAEASGTPILFNCATGLFSLDYLVQHLDRIVEELPVRFSDQEKDAGEYSQAEQVTWEVLGLIENPAIFGVDKYDRFLAAKLLVENLMTSGWKLDDPRYPTSETPENDLAETAGKLHAGLVRKLEDEYGMEKVNGRWTPKTVAQLREERGD
jgi:hypothetical protein